MAYRELRESPNRRPGNLPAVVLLTDGAPFPAEGQSNEEIERLVAANPDVPLFVILLQNRQQASTTNYERYIRFWDDMALRHNFVRSYPVNSTEEIERTYDEIVARLENSVARPPLSLAPGQTLEVFVSRYIQRVVFTFTAAARDARRRISRSRTRQACGCRMATRTCSASRGRTTRCRWSRSAGAGWMQHRGTRPGRSRPSEQVFVHIDMEGSYRVQFVEPAGQPDRQCRASSWSTGRTASGSRSPCACSWSTTRAGPR